MPPENDTPEGGNEVDVDALMAEIESPSGSAEETAEAPAPEPEAPVWDGKAWEFEWNGKKIAPDSQDKAKIWMSQGYNYSQRMGELNKTHAQKMAEAEQRAKAAGEIEQRYSPFAKVDEYARQNPQWWAKVQQEWQAAQQQQPGLDPNVANVIKPLEEKLGRFESFLQQQEQLKVEAEIKHHDESLDQEIESTRKAFPNIDLGALDPATGEPLELRILKHAQSIGTTSFKAAFRDYLHDKLIEQAKADGREAIAKGAEINAKKGILGKTQAPTKTSAMKPVNTKAPWNDPQFDAANILREMGISS